MSNQQPPGQWPQQPTQQFHPQSVGHPGQPMVPPQPPAKVRKGHKRWIIPTCTAFVGLVVGTAAGGGGDAATTSAAATVTVTETAPAAQQPAKVAPKPAKPAPAAPAVAAIPDDGTYEVGVDVQPGTYKAKDAGDLCYWARKKSTTGSMEGIIANSLGGGTRQIVTIKKSDKAFETRDCGTWVRVK